MNCPRRHEEQRGERGAALLIAIFALLLISVVGIAMIVSTGTDSALTGNYRTSTSAYYAALAGLEEARGRLLRKNPDFLNKSNAYPSLFASNGFPTFGLADIFYIVNPATSETVNPLDSSSPYADLEYQTEFGVPPSSGNVYTLASDSPLPSLSLPGPSYKWVRINAITEAALQIHINPSGGAFNTTTLLLYDPANHDAFGNVNPALIVPPNPPASPVAVQALEITSLAVLPNGSRRLLQYIAAPSALNLVLNAAVTLDGNNVSYTGPNSGSFYINGNDVNDPSVGRTCSTAPVPPVLAIGITNPGDLTNINTTHPGNGNYLGFGFVGAPPPPTPSVGQVTLPPQFQKPSTLDALVQTITENADVILPPPPATSGHINASAFPTTSSAANPMTIVINGDLDLTTWHNTGYGLLLVTGTFTYDPDVYWEGIVLVIGKGIFTASQAGGGSIDGAMLVAQTHDPSTGYTTLLPDPNLGAASVSYAPTTGGLGIYYDSCWINRSQPIFTYKILSFREIPLAN
jgi:hypothetical protein